MTLQLQLVEVLVVPVRYWNSS